MNQGASHSVDIPEALRRREPDRSPLPFAGCDGPPTGPASSRFKLGLRSGEKTSTVNMNRESE
jgi:hypothetical protein